MTEITVALKNPILITDFGEINSNRSLLKRAIRLLFRFAVGKLQGVWFPHSSATFNDDSFITIFLVIETLLARGN